MRNPAALIGLAIALLYVIYGMFFAPPSTPSSPMADAGMACIMAEKLITPQLKSPSSAKYDYAHCKANAMRVGDTWTIRSYVDADNSFGAHIRTGYIAKLTNVPPSDTWRLTDLRFVD